MALTKDQIVQGLKDLGVHPGTVVMAHSSLSAFGEVAGGANTVIEAQACGLPVVGAPIGPLMDLSEAGASVRVAGVDAPESIASLVRDLSEDGALLSALSVQARRWAMANLQAGPAIDGLERLYRRVIRERRG